MSDNDSAWIDEAGQVDDWIEFGNRSDQGLALSAYQLRDGRGRSFNFPDRQLAPGELVVVWADDDAKQGPLHAAWKLSAEGGTLELVHLPTASVSDRVEVPALELNQAYARSPSLHGEFARCRYASPERDNGETCAAPVTPELSDRSWPAYQWPSDWLRSAGPLVLSELALKPDAAQRARFIELHNLSSQTVALGSYQLRIAPIAPGRPWPGATEGIGLALSGELAASARHVVEVGEAAVSQLAADPAFEGVVTLFTSAGAVVERVDFMRWPEGASLARVDDTFQRLHYCQRASPGRENSDCEPLPAREVGDRLRHLHTPGDYAALAAGDTNLNARGVKFVLDLAAGGSVHLLSTRSYALHYTFAREQIDHQPALNRCDPAQNATFYQGWVEFSNREYFRSEGRRYLLGTLDTYSGSELRAFDFTVGDQITGEQMRAAFFGVMPYLDSERTADWAIHPNEPRQEVELEQVAGRVPIVGANAPFRGLKYQPLTLGVAFGSLQFMSAGELEHATLGPDTLVLTDAVPNDTPFVAGLITEAFQTPLAHINVLSQNRGTPNMALREARKDPRIAPLLGKLVRFEVAQGGFSLRSATSEEVASFQAGRKPHGARVVPRLDASVRGPQDLRERGLADLPSIGAKAAQLAELARVHSMQSACPGPLLVPQNAFAIPVAHYLEHLERSGARALLARAESSAAFQADPVHRAAVLAQLRAAIEDTPLEPALAAQLRQLIAQRFGGTRLRFRSSSNTEDLPGFNGAGLYESWSAELNDPERPIDVALRAVWASLWNARAYDEREYGNIDQHGVAMGVLVHPAFLSERANVIVISRNVQDPSRSDMFYMNAQAGEASVANPAPGVTSEELLHHVQLIPGTPEVEYQSRSSLTRGAHVLSLADVQGISCRVSAVHEHFRARLDPSGANRWFAMDLEVKLVGDARDVVIKQARPYSFGRFERPNDCREF